MGRRQVPSRYDGMAQQFLAVAADLIDVYLQGWPSRAAKGRLRQVRFPNALEWLRVEDVIRLTSGREAVGRKEFFSRWATREDFLPDAVAYALLREYEADDPREYIQQVPGIPGMAGPISTRLVDIADGLLSALVRHPRSYLILHLGPLLPQHPKLWNSLLLGTSAAANAWTSVYERLVTELDLVMRPEWPIERVSFVLQAMLHGFVLRHRLQPDGYPASRWEGASIFADAIIAFLLGAVDWDLTGLTGRTVLDRLVRL